jgi:hypothetical protein
MDLDEHNNQLRNHARGSDACQVVGTGFSLYGRAQLDRGLEYVGELLKQPS